MSKQSHSLPSAVRNDDVDPAQPAFAQILVVDDDIDLTSAVASYLGDSGFAVRALHAGTDLRQALERGARPDLVILDLGLPDEDGLDLLRHITTRSDTAIIILTGRIDEVDRIVGLELGADDYVTKPVHLRELLARTRSVLRRRRMSRDSPHVPSEAVASFAGWTLDVRERRLDRPDGMEVVLTSAEFTLLEVLLRHPQRSLNRDQLLDLVHGRQANLFDRSIDVLVGRLRRKLGSVNASSSLIKSVRGVGYVLSTTVTWR